MMRLLALLLLCLLLAGCVTAPNAGRTPADPPAPITCPGHWHFMLVVHVGNVALPFDNASFLQPGAVELHWDTGRLVHLHPHPTVPRCIPFAEILETFDLDIRDEALHIGPAHGAHEGTYAVDDARPLTLRRELYGDAWQDVTLAALDAATPPDGSRLLVSYDAADAATVADQQAGVPPIPDRYRPTS